MKGGERESLDRGSEGNEMRRNRKMGIEVRGEREGRKRERGGGETPQEHVEH